jgi:hypothetical protein
MAFSQLVAIQHLLPNSAQICRSIGMHAAPEATREWGADLLRLREHWLNQAQATSKTAAAALC